ncbi:hypothetical protein LX36DRAFT_388874 [Colletotrichum falcatum]|nr:hypothetical protein LX36DRAFT_388874 [Colletotrichum falcatum]
MTVLAVRNVDNAGGGEEDEFRDIEAPTWETGAGPLHFESREDFHEPPAPLSTHSFFFLFLRDTALVRSIAWRGCFVCFFHASRTAYRIQPVDAAQGEQGILQPSSYVGFPNGTGRGSRGTNGQKLDGQPKTRKSRRSHGRVAHRAPRPKGGGQRNVKSSTL